MNANGDDDTSLWIFISSHAPFYREKLREWQQQSLTRWKWLERLGAK
jgi:hypothetical protein